jgi:hypothetical protein
MQLAAAIERPDGLRFGGRRRSQLMVSGARRQRVDDGAAAG